VSASFGGKTTRIQFQVHPMVVAKLSVAPGVVAVEQGTQRQLQLFAVNPHDMVMPTATASWSSSDVNVVTVDQTGIVTAIAEGSAQVRATIDTLQSNVTVHVPTPFAAVVAGATHSCGLKPDGRVFCWGGNSEGQLGDGTRITRFAPVEVTTGLRFASVYALRGASCGLSTSGNLFCWGNNSGGRLGISGPTSILTPAAVPSAEPFSQVASGSYHICGIGVSGTTYCWGSGSATGQLSSSPVIVPTPVQTSTPFTSIVTGDQYTCGLGTDKRAYCWGVDYEGQLGDSIPDRSFTQGRATVEPVAGGHDFTALFAGPSASSTCAIAVDRMSWCWGNYVENNAASTTADCLVPMTRCTPVPIPVSTATQFTTLATGGRSVCGLDAWGEAMCWGNTYYGLGTQFLPLPTKLETSRRFKSIVAGESHQCGVTLSGAIYCWGNNEAGKIGDYSAVPTPVSPYGAAYVISPSLVAGP
jgi:alpha-tubulin suppressor-like RCC1 family protein